MSEVVKFFNLPDFFLHPPQYSTLVYNRKNRINSNQKNEIALIPFITKLSDKVNSKKILDSPKPPIAIQCNCINNYSSGSKKSKVNVDDLERQTI